MNNIGYKDDKIFLLSIEEYKKYKNKIKYIPIWWWLRSPVFNQDYAANVNYDGFVDYYGNDVISTYGAVRPALKYNSSKDTIYIYGATWDKIDENFYISRMPIEFMKFNNKSNDYENSEIRKFLLDFIK